MKTYFQRVNTSGNRHKKGQSIIAVGILTGGICFVAMVGFILFSPNRGPVAAPDVVQESAQLDHVSHVTIKAVDKARNWLDADHYRLDNGAVITAALFTDDSWRFAKVGDTLDVQKVQIGESTVNAVRLRD